MVKERQVNKSDCSEYYRKDTRQGCWTCGNIDLAFQGEKTWMVSSDEEQWAKTGKGEEMIFGSLELRFSYVDNQRGELKVNEEIRSCKRKA